MPPSAPLTTSVPDVRAVLDWWEANARVLPWRATRDIYAVWVVCDGTWLLAPDR